MYQQLKHIVDDEDVLTDVSEQPRSYVDADRDDSDDNDERN